MNQVVYNSFTNEIEFVGSPEECQEFIANYGGGWAALNIRPATTEETELYKN